MNYIILDFEFNSVPFGQKINPDANLQLEIIEFGAVKLDNNLRTKSKFQSYAQPLFYNKINQHVRRITKINQKQLDASKDFKKVMSSFINWLGREDFILCIWGKDDIAVLNKHCIFYNIDFHITKYIDVQKLFMKCHNLPHQRSLKKSIEDLTIKQYSGRFHSAINDATYTSYVFKKLIKRFKLSVLEEVNSTN